LITSPALVLAVSTKVTATVVLNGVLDVVVVDDTELLAVAVDETVELLSKRCKLEGCTANTRKGADVFTPIPGDTGARR
jgi:hypothetical protein